jgi:hypothetical protein
MSSHSLQNESIPLSTLARPTEDQVTALPASPSHNVITPQVDPADPISPVSSSSDVPSISIRDVANRVSYHSVPSQASDISPTSTFGSLESLPTTVPNGNPNVGHANISRIQNVSPISSSCNQSPLKTGMH